MAISIGDALLHLGVDKSELDAGMKSATDSIKSQMKTAGMALTSFGATVIGSLGMMTKAAVDEEVNINRLSIALQNVGIAYDDVRDSLEANITATQRKTGIADDEQRDALNQLLLVTGDYNMALKWLPLSLDLAAAKQMDLTSAATLMGRAAIGNTELLTRYGIVVKEGATSDEIFASILNKVAGAAEATVNPFNVLKATLGDLAEKVGSFLLPILKQIVDSVLPIIERIQAWIDEHPVLVKQLLILVGVLGTFAAVLGPILLMLPTLITSIGILTGPIGWVVLAIMGLITVGTLLWQNWDLIKEKAVMIFTAIKDFFVGIWANITGVFNDSINWIIDRINSLIELVNKIPFVNIGTIGHIGEEKPPAVTGYQHGGLITEPTLLYGLKSMRPYAVAGEAGIERVTPGGYQTANIIIQLDGHILARALGQPLVDEIRIKTGMRM